MRNFSMRMLAVSVWSCAALFCALGCSRDSEMRATTNGMQGTTSVGSEARGGGPRAFTDPQIAEITTVANSGEIEQGQWAAAHAQSAEVRDFANRMVAEHRAAAEQQNELLGHLQRAPVPSALSRQLSSDGVETMRTLRSFSGPSLDRAYMNAQVREHQRLLTLLDESLIPSALELGMRAQLERMRDLVARHLEHARSVQAGLTGFGSASGP